MPITLKPKATTEIKLQNLGQGNEIDDVVSLNNGPPISGGVFTVTKADDQPFRYEYKYDEVKVILEGEIDLKDEKTGEVHEAKAGDILAIPKGTVVLFSSKSFGRAFYAGSRNFRDF